MNERAAINDLVHAKKSLKNAVRKISSPEHFLEIRYLKKAIQDIDRALRSIRADQQ
jgi:hypothetical protein